jgi:hypothetical protein
LKIVVVVVPACEDAEPSETNVAARTRINMYLKFIVL